MSLRALLLLCLAVALPLHLVPDTVSAQQSGDVVFVPLESAAWSCAVPLDPNEQSRVYRSKKGVLKKLSFKKVFRLLQRRIEKLSTKIQALSERIDSAEKPKKLKAKRQKVREQRSQTRKTRRSARKCKNNKISHSQEGDETPTPSATPDPSPSVTPSPSPTPGLIDPPQPLAGIPGDKQNTLSWNDVAEAEEYRVYWSLSPGVTAQNGNPLSNVSSPFVHTNLSNGIEYFYIVTAYSTELGESAPSNEVSLTPSAIGPYDPPWGDIEPLNIIDFTYNAGMSAVQNGANLKNAVAALQPGDMLRVSDGVYNLGTNNWNLNVLGTASAPISVVAQDGAKPILERNTTSKNIIEMGHAPTRYFRMEGFEMRGGSAGIRMFDTQNVWLNKNEIHSTADAALTTNTANTSRLYITRNVIHDTAGYGEGMYLGANNGAVVMDSSIIALNHVYNTQNTIQGDGIELKQGSWGNWIVENLVHDTKYPCILVYGTNGNQQNVIERNIVYNSLDNVMQVQGEALVVNNLIMNGGNGFYSHDHQGATRDLQVIHNTIVNSSTAARLVNWNNRENMVFANNVVYSQNGSSINFSGGSNGVAIAGNVVRGPVQNVPSGYIVGNGLSDFVNLSYGQPPVNPYPSSTSAFIGAGNASFAVPDDLAGNTRVTALEAGALDFSN